MNVARKQRCNATHMDDAGYKHSCKLLIGHPGNHKCSKFSYSWEDCKRPMNPKPLDAGLAERLWKTSVNAIWISLGRPSCSRSQMKNHNYKNAPFYDKAAFEAVAEECREIVKEATRKGRV